MADNSGINQIRNLLQRLSAGQRIGLLAAITVTILVMILVTTVLNTPSYAMLFSNVNPQDASKIVDKLKEKNIPYKLEDAGKTILIPKGQIYDVRLSLAGEGLPQSSVIGYEIFDRTNLGVSDFVQKVNYRRAVEGELTRTILQLEEVEGARVHIVVPEKVLFKEDEKPATASVVLKLKSGKPLRKESIQGITHLVSSSIEGLEASNVSVLDSKGVLLSDANQPNSVTTLTSTQYELQQKVELYLSQKAQRLLENVVGAGNAVVQVNADLDFRQVERNLEQYDPESAVVRSEQTTEEKNIIADSLPPSTRANTVTNYEINKTVEHIVENMGSVKRLSIATMVNAIPKVIEKDGVKSTEFTPRKDEEIQQFENIVKRAVGFDTERNDEITTVSMPFGNGITEEQLVYKETPFSNYMEIGQKVLLIIAMLAGVLIIRSIMNRVKIQSIFNDNFGYENDGEPMGALASGAVKSLQRKRAAIHLPSAEEEISDDALMKIEKRKRITEYVQEKPDDAVRLLKVWLTEE